MAIMGFNPLWINTALKPGLSSAISSNGFNPLWINTALKRKVIYKFDRCSFNPLWINTALKRLSGIARKTLVSIPYGLTLLSNRGLLQQMASIVSIPYGLTLLSNLKFEKTTCISLYYSLGNFILRYISHKS